MLPPFAFRVLRVLGLLLVPVGLLAAGVGGAAIVTTPASSPTYGVTASPAEDPADATPLAALNESQRALAERAIEHGDAHGPRTVAESLDGRVISSENGTYRLRSYRSEPRTDPFAYVFYGGLVAVFVGFFTAAASHLTLRVA